MAIMEEFSPSGGRFYLGPGNENPSYPRQMAS
jgi:hypothetical protein